MKTKHFKAICKSIYDKQIHSYNKRVQYRLLYGLSLDPIKKEDPTLYSLINDEDSSDSDDDQNIIYNAREVLLREDDYINQDEYDEEDDTCDENTNDAVFYKNTSEAGDNKLLEINPVVETHDVLPDLSIFKESDTTAATAELKSWFPVFVNGVCRFLGMMKTERSHSFYDTVTETVLDYKHEEKLVVTCKCQYKLVGPMDKRYLRHDAEWLGISFELSQEFWLKEIVAISKVTEFNKRSLINTKLRGLSSAKIHIFKVKQMSRSKRNTIFGSNLKKVAIDSDNFNIRLELEQILEQCKNRINWQSSFKDFLIKIDQINEEIEHMIYDGPQMKNIGYRNVDIDEPDNYDDFVLQGVMANSTLNHSMENLYLWSIQNNNAGKLCLTGLRKVGISFKEVVPTVIKSISSEGTCVITEDEQYKLIGPMYMLSIHCSYPKTNNSFYLDLFQEHFMKGLPKYWKSLVIIMHVLCGMCTELRYKTNISDVPFLNEGEKSPSYNSASICENTSHKVITVDFIEENIPNDVQRHESEACISDSTKKPTSSKCGKNVNTQACKNDPSVIIALQDCLNNAMETVTPPRNSKRNMKTLDLTATKSEVNKEVDTQRELSKDLANSISTIKLPEKRCSKTHLGSKLRLDNKSQEDRKNHNRIDSLPQNLLSTSSSKSTITKSKNGPRKRRRTDQGNKENVPKKRSRVKETNLEDSEIDPTIHLKLGRSMAESDKFSSHKSLKIKSRIPRDNHDLIYQPIVGFPVNLSRLPITLSGRISLPPPDILSRTRFEKVGNEVHFISQSKIKMIFKK